MNELLLPTPAGGPQGAQPAWVTLAERDGPSLRAAWGALRRRWLIVLATMVVFSGATAAFVLTRPSLYAATATIMLQTGKEQLSDMQAIRPGELPDTSMVGTEMDVLRSDAIAQAVVRKLHLDTLPEFVPPRSPVRQWIAAGIARLGLTAPQGNASTSMPPSEIAVNTLLGKMGFMNTERSYVIRISALTQEAGLSATIANAYAEAYMEFRREQKLEALRRANGVFDDYLIQLQAKVLKAEDAVQTYRAAHGLTQDRPGSPTAAPSLVAQQMGQVLAQLSAAEGERAQKEADLNQLTALQAAGRVEMAPQVQASPVIRDLLTQLAQASAREATLASTYGHGNPLLAAARAEVADLRRSIAIEGDKVAVALSAEVSAAIAHQASLSKQLEQLRRRLDDESRQEMMLRELEAQARAQRAIYEDTLVRAQRASSEVGMQVPDVSLIASARPPASRSSPRIVTTIAFAIVSSAVIGVLFAFLRERLQGGIRTLEELQEIASVPALGLIPRVRSRVHPSLARRPDRSYSEAVTAVRSRLLGAPGRDRHKVVLVTSAVPGEGKTSFAIALAASMAGAGRRSIVVDCDLRRHAVARTVGLPRRALARGHDAEPVALRPNLHILTWLPGDPRAPDHLVAPPVRDLVGRLRADYDLVVLDSPPVLPVADALLLSELADCVVMVARWESTPPAVVANALKGLAESGTPVAGMLLTRVNLRKYVASGTGAQAYLYGKFGRYYANHERSRAA